MPNIPQKDAALILRQSAKFPQKGDQCNAACAFYFCCTNGRDFEECRGFQMVNGESEKLLRRGLAEHDFEYIENAHTFIQRSIEKGRFGDAEVIIRDMSQLREKATAQPSERPSGISYMAQCALGIQNTQSENTEPESQPPSEFHRMLEASGKGSTKNETVRNPVAEIIQRQMPTDFEYQLPEICNDTCIIKRHCGAYPSQVGSPCIKKMEQYRNDKFVGK